MNKPRLQTRIRLLLLFFIAALAVSGLTAFPLVWEVELLQRFLGTGTFMEQLWPALAQWIALVKRGLIETNDKYPFVLYGMDWLAFAHLMIAVAFLGPLRDPVRNIWVVEFGMIACLMIIPLALIFGPLRGIPPFWLVLDCSFGVVGIVPLWLARRDILRLAAHDNRVPT
jgi:hypothetical protein